MLDHNHDSEAEPLSEHMQEHVKTRADHVASAAKYVVPAATGSWALTAILMFAFPTLEPIQEPILALITIAINLITVAFTKE